jgi:beta-glucosidase
MRNKSISTITKTSLLFALVFSGISWASNPEKKAPDSTPIITVNGFTFSDLNRDGKLDKYEDYRLSTQDRIQDLINKMTDDEKASMQSELECPDLIWWKPNLFLVVFKVKFPELQVGHLN